MIRRIVTFLAALIAIEAYATIGFGDRLSVFAAWAVFVAMLTPAVFLSIRDAVLRFGGAS